ncbi:MAG: Rne/Rng family ribonuclease [Mycobacterium sp.]
MADDAQHQYLPENAAQRDQEIPDRLRVHSLARVLGTTSRRVLEALSELDGRTRSPHSSVDRSDAVKVRDVLAAAAPAAESPNGDGAHAEAVNAVQAEVRPPEPVAQPEPEPVADVESQPEPEAEPQHAEAGPEAVVEPADAAEEPESRLEPAVEPADYLPLFVAPQPIEKAPVRAAAPARSTTKPNDDDDDDDDEDDESDVNDSDGADSDFADSDFADSDSADSDGEDSDGDQAERPNRRRRRGRRGRGRGRGADDNSSSDDKSDSDGELSVPNSSDEKGGPNSSEDTNDDDSDDDSGDDDQNASDGASRRRRRRRRRKGGSADNSSSDGESGSADDPPNTVVHERAPRPSGKDPNEIQGISGSTRLEAKRQRRRDGRDTGRRRPPILTEAEFLARREAVERVMVVRDKVRSEPPHEGARYTQIAVLEDGVLVEHFVTSAGSASLVGNVYLGIVQNVLPSMEAAFVDIGRGRNGVLYAGEVNWEAAGLGGAARKIEQALRPGDYVVVQVSKDPVGHKGARLTTQVSLAGRYLVYVPGASSTGISRKLPDTERQRLKEILRDVVPSDAGVIIRTASEGVKEDDIRADVTRLQERWTQIDQRARSIKGNASGAAVALYEEPNVLVKVIRDLFNEDFSGLIVSGDDAWSTIGDYVNSVAPELVSKLNKYDSPGSDGQSGPDVFAIHRIDEQLAKAMDRKVWLPSGGTLVIDRTEAMTVIDVNTGKFTGSGGNLEQTVTKNNLEAAEETVRQLRLRDIGGIVVIDFIDMVLENNRDLVLRRLTEALARDRTRHQVSEVTSLGLVQLTRKKLGTGLVEAFSTTCTYCAGRGIVLHSDPVDSQPSQGRGGGGGGGSAPKAESGNRRGKRAKKGKPEEVAAPVARVPSHAAGEHPMFKAMAAANGKHEGDEDADDEFIEDVVHDAVGEERADDTDMTEEVAEEVAEEDLDDDFDDSDDDDSDDDDSDDDDDDDDIVDLDDEDDDDSDEDDEDDDDSDDDDSDEDDDDSDDEDEDDEDDEDEDEDFGVGVAEADERAAAVAVVTTVRRPRRRAAARPAGPPVLDD